MRHTATSGGVSGAESAGVWASATAAAQVAEAYGLGCEPVAAVLDTSRGRIARGRSRSEPLSRAFKSSEMKLTLRQDRIDALDKCEVRAGDRVLFKTRRSATRSIRQETIVEDLVRRSVLRIDPQFYMWRPAYDVLRDGERIAFRTLSWLRRVYCLACRESPLTIYSHRSLAPRYSVFLAGTQIAAILRRPFSILGEDTFTIFLEPNADPALLVAVTLILDRISGSNGYRLLTIHGPSSLLQAREFDESWLERAKVRAA